MANNSLGAARRTVLGKKVKALRRSGITPANVYGHKIESTAVQANTVDVVHLLRAAGRNAIIDLKIEDEAAVCAFFRGDPELVATLKVLIGRAIKRGQKVPGITTREGYV